MLSIFPIIQAIYKFVVKYIKLSPIMERLFFLFVPLQPNNVFMNLKLK